ncbi:MAG: hypothetical protein CME71_03255 [Halobacteriovorax sp.]|nr:hypothetical protein [Halobacteriovorax sp.]
MSTVVIDEISMPADMYFLILEDTEIFQKKLVQTLNNLGFTGNITMTDTVASALEALNENQPDFILSDWNLPDGKGIDFLKKVRANEQYSKTPFVMVTTMDSIDDILDAVTVGADDYVVKPWEEKEMAEKISSAYAKRKK